MDNTLRLISQVRHAIQRYITEALVREGVEGIVPSHGDIMVHLFQHETQTMKELAKKINKDPSTVTTLVKKLIAMGYVERVADIQDKRANPIRLTEKGKALKPIFNHITESVFRQLYQDITEEELILFRKVLIKMYENLTCQQGGLERE
ncbi:MarR family transcriptional regulator [Niameybacter massiliensis]|uniref:MarR family transcriptional regulator n=1 Tax=Holtiella tumoricola TaxID=3018743 RepID=A0AA42J1Z1_9FIRM|nr:MULTISPECIES: MarR family transcriptional regulator [Lachnospirales]MDA3733039.1 MarR family transcriptional regulator [Holtiella tumoricola]